MVLHLLDCLLRQRYQPDSLNIKTIFHALCHSNRFSEAHHHLFLFISFHRIPDERTYNVLIVRLLDSRTAYTTLHVVCSHCSYRQVTWFLNPIYHITCYMFSLCELLVCTVMFIFLIKPYLFKKEEEKFSFQKSI